MQGWSLRNWLFLSINFWTSSFSIGDSMAEKIEAPKAKKNRKNKTEKKIFV